jgi:cobalt-zinc-cadmium efflux system membrane fusion protein
MGRAKADYLIARDEYALAEAEHARQKLLFESKEQILSQAKAGVTAEEALRLMRDVPLGDRKSLILTAVSGVEFAQNERERARLLFEQKIGAHKNLLRAEKELTESRIKLAAILEDTAIEAQQILLNAEMAERMKRAVLERAEEELLLLGLTAEQIDQIEREPAGRKSMVPITAPFDGTLVEQHVSLGEIVDPSTYLYRLADLAAVWVRADVYEKDLSFVCPGKEVSIAVPAYPGGSFKGTIVYVSSEMDKEKRTVAARIQVDNSTGELKPGMFCTGTVGVGSCEGPRAPLVVPVNAVQDIEGTATVFVPCGENRFVAVPVVTGEQGEGWVAITSGLSEGDVIVAEGSFILKSDLMKGSFRKGYED